MCLISSEKRNEFSINKLLVILETDNNKRITEELFIFFDGFRKELIGINLGFSQK